MLDDVSKVRMALVSLAIEKSLLEIGKPTYDKVVNLLKKEYNCYLPECYEHPEYLSEILKMLYGDASRQIIKSINIELEEFSNIGQVERFLEVIAH